MSCSDSARNRDAEIESSRAWMADLRAVDAFSEFTVLLPPPDPWERRTDDVISLALDTSSRYSPLAGVAGSTEEIDKSIRYLRCFTFSSMMEYTTSSAWIPHDHRMLYQFLSSGE